MAFSNGCTARCKGQSEGKAFVICDLRFSFGLFARFGLRLNVACESAGKPDALQTLRDKARQGNKFAPAFGVRPACRRFRSAAAMPPNSEEDIWNRRFSEKISALVAGGGRARRSPVYLAALLLLKAMASMSHLVKPFASLLPSWLPAGQLLSLLLVLTICWLIGVAVRTATGRAVRERIEKSLFQRILGYSLFRSLTQRLAGENRDSAWRPALVEIEEALVPAFIIEELEDGRFTVFVPSVPTPLAGAIYILTPDRVHPLNVPFTKAIQTVSRWGSGSKDLVAAMEVKAKPSAKKTGEGR